MHPESCCDWWGGVCGLATVSMTIDTTALQDQAEGRAGRERPSKQAHLEKRCREEGKEAPGLPSA